MYGEEEKQELFTVVEEEAVSDIVDAAVAQYPWADEVFQAAVWLIAKDRESGEPIPGTTPLRRLMYLRPNRLAKSPGVLVRYWVEDVTAGAAEDRIVVDWVKFYDYDDDDAVTPAAYIHKP